MDMKQLDPGLLINIQKNAFENYMRQNKAWARKEI